MSGKKILTVGFDLASGDTQYSSIDSKLSLSKTSSGTMLLFPDIDFYDDQFIKENGDKQKWTPAAAQFAGKFVSAIVALGQALRSSSEVTPEPEWAKDSKYVLGQEADLRRQLLEAERRVEQTQREKEEVADRLAATCQYRGLLYEKGKPFESVIVGALRVMGFTATPFKESDSEFDVVFECSVGEAEGKDNKAANIDKLRQLSMNIHEDLQREEASTPAKPVLFGNAFRLQKVSERPDPFTEKCHRAAATSSTALVHTPDLFEVIRYLLECSNGDYASDCRHALLNCTGRVHFPGGPASPSTPSEVSVGPAQ